MTGDTYISIVLGKNKIEGFFNSTPLIIGKGMPFDNTFSSRTGISSLIAKFITY
jgi:hypothetical protein